MPFTNNVNYIPNMPSGGHDHLAAQEQKKTQRKRWQVLVGVFVFVLTIANIFIWARPPEFQSQAILHFSYATQNAQELDYIAQQQLILNQKRLTSNSMLQALSAKLRGESLIDLNIQQLRDMLSATSSSAGQIITLHTAGAVPELLKPALEQWLTLYMSLLERERVDNNSDEILQYQQQLTALEHKITEQQQIVDVYSQANNIISLERDENRIPNKIKRLGASLDEAEAQKSQALAELDSLNESRGSGQLIERPVDKTSIDANRAVLQKLEAELSALSEKYTQEYLQRDPDVVSKQQKFKILSKDLEQQIADSQLLYFQDSQRNLTVSVSKANALREQLAGLQNQAQVFNQKLEHYRSLDKALKELQLHEQTLKNQLIEQEVLKPFVAKISILEQPFTPQFPIGPDYWQDTLISIVAAIVSAVIALLLFSFIVRQKSLPAAGTNFVVLPGQQQANHYPELPLTEQDKLPSRPQPLQIGEGNIQHANIRLLTVDECQRLYRVANKQAKVVISLLLSGVNATELCNITKADFVEVYTKLQITGAYARQVNLTGQLTTIIEQLCADLQADDLLWSSPLSIEDFCQIIINASHDAELPYPEQLSTDVLRHTYLTYLVSQGARLNDLEQLSGYLEPAEVGRYRAVNRHGKSVDVDQVDTIFPYDGVAT